MGNASSSETAIFALDPFVGITPLPDDDPLFDHMLCARVGAEHVSHADEVLDSLCEQLERNNSHTHNFQKLLRRVLARVREAHTLGSAKASEEVMGGAANALFVARIFLRALLQAAQDVEMMRSTHILKPGTSSDNVDGDIVGELFRTLVDVVVDLERTPETTPLLIEACLCALTLLSAQMYSPLLEPPVGMLGGTLCAEYRAADLARALLLHLALAPAPLAPAAAESNAAANAGRGDGSGGSRAWGLLPAVLYLPRTLFSLLFITPGDNRPPPTLPDAAACLLLVLAQDLPRPLRAHVSGAPFTGVAAALTSLLNLEGGTKAEGGGEDLETVGGASRGAGVPFAPLLARLCAGLPAEAPVLLLYHLLHKNAHFRRFALARTDVDSMLVPILRGVYDAATAKEPPQPARVYMLLILVLMLSQDPAFVETAHRVTVPRAPWVKERILGEVSVGSLAMIVLCRLVHANLNSAARRDPYVSSNCVAALANLCACAPGIHPYAAASIVGLYARLERRRSKLLSRADQAAAAGGPAPLPTTVAGVTIQSAPRMGVEEEALREDAAQVAESMRVVLEGVNCVLSSHMATGTHLVYALLERQTLFREDKVPDEAKDVLANIQAVISHFAPRVVAAAGPSALAADATLPVTTADVGAEASSQSLRTSSEVIAAIEEAGRDWRGGVLRPMPELRFTYEQEPDAEEFFTPYLWTVAVETTSLVAETGAQPAEDEDHSGAPVGAAGGLPPQRQAHASDPMGAAAEDDGAQPKKHGGVEV